MMEDFALGLKSFVEQLQLDMNRDMILDEIPSDWVVPLLLVRAVTCFRRRLPSVPLPFRLLFPTNLRAFQS
jgi:hypothetical protein